MNRKRHNTASALMVTGTVFAFGLLAHFADLSAAPASRTARATASVGTEARTQAPIRAAFNSASQGNGRSRRIRHSMAMPFFSFASRG